MSIGYYQFARADAKTIAAAISPYRTVGYPIYKLKMFLFLTMLPYYFQALLWDRQITGFRQVLMDSLQSRKSFSALIYRIFRLIYLASPITAYLLHCLNVQTEYSIYSVPAASAIKM